MQKLLEPCNIKLPKKVAGKVTMSELSVLVPVVLKFVPGLRTVEEIRQAIEREFSCSCSMDTLIDYYSVDLQVADLEIMFKQCGLNY